MRCLLKKFFLFNRDVFSTFFALSNTSIMHRLSNGNRFNDVLYVSDISIE